MTPKRSHAAGVRPDAKPNPEFDGLLPAHSPHIEPLALMNLARMDAPQALVAELIVFGGLTEEEIAEGPGISARTARRERLHP